MNKKKAPPPSDLADKFMLRLPPGMREQLKEWANAEGRSMNAEIIHRLQQSFEPPELMTGKFLDENYLLRRKLEDWAELLIQLTPEEMRILQERGEIARNAKTLPLSSKAIAKFTQLRRIGGQRVVLTVPSAKDAYDALFDRTVKE
ncbi:Arc family DNA-binding protein [Ensifer sp. BR816]|uniref:Arc family DNA-binding protein n=1 Tax=Rhizobium sp. (strain BR816) TaxID=1057002 RepID=UPI000A061B51|nr:Arc family DNA-binding protein [Ensifer sp. BR816]